MNWAVKPHKVRGNPPRLSGWVILAWVIILTGRGAAGPLIGSDPEYLIQSWSSGDGLPDSSATSMVQTADGYLWFGTLGGLVRFNGRDFRVFNRSNTPGFPGVGVVNLHLDKQGRLWMSTLEGLGIREGGNWRTWGKEDGWTRESVRTFAERKNGDLLLTGFDGYLMEFSRGRFHPLPEPGEKGQGYFGYADPEDHWWVVQNQFTGRWDNDSWTGMLPASSQGRTAVAAAAARDGAMWLLTGSVLRKVRGGREIQRVELPGAPGDYWSLSEDSHGQVWICTTNSGLIRVSPNGPIRRWSISNGLTAQSLRFASEDREGNVWIGTNGGGLQRLTPKRFRSFSADGNAGPSNFSSVSARAAGGVWVSSYGQGLFQGGLDGLKTAEAPPNSYPALLQCVLEDRAGRVWLGSYADGFYILENGRARALPEADTGGGNGIALFEDSRGVIWMSGGQGVANFEEGQFHSVGSGDGLPPGAVSCFAEAPPETIWAVHHQGVFRKSGQRFESVKDFSGKPVTGIACLCADPDGHTMWMGDAVGGLMRWREGRLDKVSADAGLPNDGISGLMDDTLGNLWISTRHGVVRAGWNALQAGADHTLRKVTCIPLDASDGLPGLELSRGRQPLAARDRDGHLWFPLLRGVAVMDPAGFAPGEAPLPVQVEEMTYVVPASVNAAASEVRIPAPLPSDLTLPAGSRQMSIHYAGFDFAAPEKVRYQVMLEGRDNGWQDMKNANVATFYELPAGKYVFRVRAANRDGVWNETGTAVRFAVSAFYWETLWFRAGGAALLMAVGAGFTWWLGRQRHLRMGEKLEAEQQRSELAHLSRVTTLSELSGSLAHELNQPLAIILSNAQAAQRILNHEPPDIAEIRDILSDIVSEDRRAGQVIQRLRALLKRGESLLLPENLNSLVEEVLSLTRQDLMNRGVKVKFDFKDDLPLVRVDRVQLEQVVLNLITNACDAMASNSAEDRCLNLETSEKEGEVRLAVMDRGCGLPSGDAEHIFKAFVTTKGHGLGLGLSISRSIMQAHHGSLKAERHPQRGTIFMLTLPAASPE